jgi:hypothetical protein
MKNIPPISQRRLYKLKEISRLFSYIREAEHSHILYRIFLADAKSELNIFGLLAILRTFGLGFNAYVDFYPFFSSFILEFKNVIHFSAFSDNFLHFCEF